MGGVDLHVVGQRQELAVQRIVERVGELAWIGIRIAQIRTADVAHEEQVAGEHDGGLPAFAHQKTQAVG